MMRFVYFMAQPFGEDVLLTIGSKGRYNYNNSFKSKYT